MSTITVKDGINPMRPSDYELEGHTLSPLIRCPYSNETSEIREKRLSFGSPSDLGYGLNPPTFSAHLGEKLSRASIECAGKRIIIPASSIYGPAKRRRLL
jgi:hypothetical protein